jgi:hypothetical protein
MQLLRPKVYGFRTDRIRLRVEQHALPFTQRTHAGAFQGRYVYENVLAAALGRDEAETFGRVVELNYTCPNGT